MDYIANRIWFLSEFKLFELCELIERHFELAEFEFDAENLYEWGEALAQDGSWKINISRQHCEGEPQPNEFYHIVFNGDIPPLTKIAQQLATLVDGEVYLGLIKYLGGDDYQYCPSHTFKPDAQGDRTP